MLDKLDVIKKATGFIQVQCDPSLSPAFLLLHFVESFSRRNLNVVFVSNHHSSLAIKIMCAKMMIRLNENKFNLLPLHSVLDDSFDGDRFLRLLEMKLHELLSAAEEALVVFDDLDAIRQLSAERLLPLAELQMLLRLRSRLSPNALIVGVTADDLHGFGIFNNIIRLAPIGTGFGANITGELTILKRDTFTESRYERTQLHYFVGERNAKLFYPGSSQILI